MTIRDRIKSLRRVKASELRPHPKNWRTHPDAQRYALSGVLEEIGYADALLVRELPDGSLELIDGHLRADLTPDQKVPCLVLDITEEEAEKLLAVFDPLAAMAEADRQALGELLAGLEVENEALQEMLEGLAEEHGIDSFEPGSLEDSFAGVAARETGLSEVTFVFPAEQAKQVRRAIREDGMEYWAGKIVEAVNNARVL